MKKMTIIKTAKALCAAMVLGAVTFTAFSCSNSIGTELDFKASSEENVPVLHISLNDSSRTIMPQVELSELTDIKLYGVQSEAVYEFWDSYSAYSTIKELSSADNIESFNEKEIYLPRSNNNTWWRFYLTAKKGNNTFAAMTSAPQKIVIGDNTISFVLKLQEITSGTGTLNFTVDYSQATDDSSLVTKATCTLYAIGEDDVIATTATEILEATPTEDALNVVFAKDEFASGCYQALINLYSGDVVVGYWVEVVQISDSMTSGGTITISKLVKPYTFHYVQDSSVITDAKELIYPLGYETVLYGSPLPVPTYSGLAFVDWYIDDAFETPFTWANIDNCTKDQDGKIVVYANWINKSTNTNTATAATVKKMIQDATGGTSADSPVEIKVVGPVTSKTLADIDSELAKTTKYFSLDLSEATGIEYLASNSDTVSRFNNAHLVSITLPASVKNIENAFSGCSVLKEINIAADNPTFKSEEGIVYSKDGKVLYVYPPAKFEIDFQTPDGVKKIASSAFANVTGINSHLYIASDVVIIEPKAFYGASMSTISINGYGSWYKSEKELTNANDVLALCRSSSNSTSTSTITGTKSTTSSYSNYYFYQYSLKDILQMDGIEYVDVYEDSSLDVGDGTYTIIESDRIVYYKIKTVSGTKYTVNWVDSYSYDDIAYVVPETLKLTDNYIYIYNSDMNNIANTDDNPTLIFNATSDTTIIQLEPRSGNNLNCAFRVKVAN